MFRVAQPGAATTELQTLQHNPCTSFLAVFDYGNSRVGFAQAA
jgi:hypothetical protein